MNEKNDFLSNLTLSYSNGASATHGFVVCKWNGDQWEIELDRSEPNAVKRLPVSPGTFVGQMRSVICEAPPVEEPATAV